MNETDVQAIDMLQKFWRQNGRFICIVLVLFVLSFFGIKYWKSHFEEKTLQASALYSSVLKAMHDSDFKAVSVHGERLKSDYSNTPYSQLASLLLAKVAIDEGTLDVAQEHLEWVVRKKNDKQLIWHIARVRLARLLQEKQDYNAALNIISGPYNGYSALYEEVKGDIYLAQGENDKAKNAYLAAIASMPKDDPTILLDLKLMNLGVIREENS